MSDSPADGSSRPLPGAADDPFRRLVVVLHEPQDLVNVALVIRGMMNMGLRHLRVVNPDEEMDPYRLTGIAHGSDELVEAAEVHDSLEEALSDCTHVVGTSARRRSVKQQWREPGEAAPEIVARTGGGNVAVVFGREDKGLSNDDLDRCHELLNIPTNPEKTSLNLSHAALIVFYELRQAVREEQGVPERDLSPKPTHQVPRATAEQLESLFEVWEEALDELGMFSGIDPGPKMTSFRSIFQRAELDEREVRLLKASAYEILHYARRERARLRGEIEGDDAGEEE